MFSNFIVMELYPYSLYKYIRSKEYKSKGNLRKLNIALDVAKGLSFLHANQIIHCDVHSGNVLYDPDRGKVGLMLEALL